MCSYSSGGPTTVDGRFEAMTVTFLQPTVLWALLLVVFYGWGVWRWGGVGDLAPRRRAMLAARMGVAMLLILALARPQLVRSAGRVCVVALVDGSRSVPPEGTAAADSLLNALRSRSGGGGRNLLVYRFDRGASRTDLASALRVASQRSNSAARVLRFLAKGMARIVK